MLCSARLSRAWRPSDLKPQRTQHPTVVSCWQYVSFNPPSLTSQRLRCGLGSLDKLFQTDISPLKPLGSHAGRHTFYWVQRAAC